MKGKHGSVPAGPLARSPIFRGNVRSINKEEPMEWTLDGGTAAWGGIGKWTESAACRGAPTEWFVGNPSPPAEAYEICAGCSVRSECESFGEKERDDWGPAVIYGGKLFHRVMGGRPRIYPCGTYQGRRRHERRGEEVCARCRDKQRKKKPRR